MTLQLDGDLGAPAVVVLGHGAGADIRHLYMEHFAHGLAQRGLGVCRFNFPYVEAGRKTPDKQPVLEDAYRAAVDELRSSSSSGALVVGGKSLGGRIASHVVAQGMACHGLVFLGYPLHPPGRPERMRDAHLAEITVPMLFVEGTRDPFCPLDTLERVISSRGLRADVHVVEGGDHSHRVRKSSGRTTEQAWNEAIEEIARWVNTLT